MVDQKKPPADSDDDQTQTEDHDVSGDDQFLNTCASLGVIVGSFYGQTEADKSYVYKTLNGIDTDQLLNSSDLTYFGKISEALHNSNLVTDLGEKDSMYMSEIDVKRRDFSLKTAKRFHDKINDTNTEARIQNAIREFDLKDENKTLLRSRIKEWLKEHPGSSVETGLFAEGRKLYLAQNSIIEDTLSQDKKTAFVKKLEQINSDIKEFGKTSREKLFDKKNQTIESVAVQNLQEKVKVFIEETLDPNKPVFSPQEFEKRLNELFPELSGGKPTSTKTVASSSPPPSSAPPGKSISQPVPAVTSTPPPISIPIGMPISIPVSTPVSMSPPPVAQITPAVTGGGTGGGFGSFLGRGFRSFLGSGGGLAKAGKGLLNLGASAIPPLRGFWAGLQAANRLTGGLAGRMFSLVVAGLILLAVGIPFVILSGLNMFASNTSNNSYRLRANSDNWYVFEKNFLVYEKSKQVDWETFSLGNLNLEKKYLSLDTNRHDDVQK